MHTVDNHILCGGPGAVYSCIQWSPDTGTWEVLITMDAERVSHVSWTPANGIGIYLMGGQAHGDTTTLVKAEGSQETGFLLRYDSR